MLFFDYWKQSVTSRYRICAQWLRVNGSPSQWTFTNGASSATFATTASAATIQAALETITGVVSATVTGGPLPFHHVDIEVEWTTNTGRFTDIAVQRVSTTGRPVYSFADGAIAGRALFTIPLGSTDVITSDNTGVVTGNATRHLITSDSDGLLIGTGTVWSVTAINASRTPACSGMPIVPGVKRAAFGRVLVTVNRSTNSGTTLTHVVLNEADGSSVGGADAAMDFVDPLMIDSNNVAVWGIDDCGVRMTGGEQFNVMPSTGGTPSAESFMVQGTVAGADGDIAIVNGPREAEYSDFSGLLDSSLTIAVSDTLVTGGDAFFPTASYIRKRVYFSSPATLWNDTTEWRIVLYNGSTKVHETAWLAYSDGDTEVEAELDAWYGNNSASLPAIQIQFGSTDNSITPLMWFQRSGAEILVTASSDPVAIAAHNLVPSSYTFRVELRDASVRTQRSICSVDLADSTVLWQRDIGTPFSGLDDVSDFVVTYDHGIVVALATRVRSSNSHPSIVGGPLP